jgi:hypothetical protein
MGQTPRFAEKPRFAEEEPSANVRLNSWKEIAAYLDRDPRTVQLWEKSLRLPVHRLNHNSRASVYAYTAEVDAWLHLRSISVPEVRPELRLHPPASLLSAALSIKRTRIAAVFTLAIALLGNVLAWYWVARRPARQPRSATPPSCQSIPPSAR